MDSKNEVANSEPRHFEKHYPKEESDLWPKRINRVFFEVKNP